MPKNYNRTPKDPRSTGRRRARAVLLQQEQDGLVEHKCARCGADPKIHVLYDGVIFEKLKLPETVLGDKTRVLPLILQADHINKNVLDNDPVNLQWLCPICHKLLDQTTGRGISRKENEHGYGRWWL